MFVKVEDHPDSINFVKNELGEIVPEEPKSDDRSEATAEPVFG